uniref:Uncharacterized protein n=1 Tax=Anguilla anguilla TaxID=7936 RepID=A0A0E9UJZ0_ANGAN
MMMYADCSETQVDGPRWDCMACSQCCQIGGIPAQLGHFLMLL